MELVDMLVLETSALTGVRVRVSRGALCRVGLVGLGCLTLTQEVTSSNLVHGTRVEVSVQIRPRERCSRVAQSGRVPPTFGHVAQRVLVAQ